MLMMKLWDLVPRGQESHVLQYLERLVSQGQSSMETVLLAKDGRPIDVEIHATALFDQERGGLVHSRAFVRDVTERHRLEQELQHYTSELEQAVSERTQQLVGLPGPLQSAVRLGGRFRVYGGRDGDDRRGQ